MHPSTIWWARARREREDACTAHAGCGPRGKWARGGAGRGRSWRHATAGEGSNLGVRRPLRFLSHKLDLDDKQTASLARIIDELKTERAQAAVDDRRTIAGYADVVASAEFDQARALAAAERRVDSAQRLRDAVVKALGEIHAVLDEEQRQDFAYLIRTGVIAL